MADEERVVAVDGGGEEGCGGPDEGAGDDEGFAGEVVAEPAGGGGDEHVGEEEGGGEESGLRVVDMEFALDEGLDAGENVAVDKVEEVEGGEEEEREGGGAGWVDARGHRVGGRIAGGLTQDRRAALRFISPSWVKSQHGPPVLLDCHGDRARCVHRARRTGNRHRVGPRGGAWSSRTAASTTASTAVAAAARDSSTRSSASETLVPTDFVRSARFTRHLRRSVFEGSAFVFQGSDARRPHGTPCGLG